MDDQWTQVIFDISSMAANQPTVYIKFTMGPTDSTIPFSGWNIDDLEVTSDYSGPIALYVPSGSMPNPNIDEMLIQTGLGIKYFDEIPSDLNDYALLIISEYGACNPTTAKYIKDFVKNGGGAIIMGGAPKFLAGDTDYLDTISYWFGAGRYGNDCDYGIVIINNPLGTDLLINDKLSYTPADTCWAASVYNLNPETTAISTWTSYGRTHSFIHHFGLGKILYYATDPGYSAPDPILTENDLILFEAGLQWVLSPLPDLIVSTLTGPINVAPGQEINLSEATKNQGSGATTVNTMTRFYWSTNTTYNASDIPLGERTVGPLAAEETLGPVDTLVTIPPTAATGTYYIIAKADADKSVAETSETNNTKYIKVKIP
jgi:hypothetical protein